MLINLFYISFERRDVEKRINQEKNALLERRQAEAHQHINKRRADGHINRESSESVSNTRLQICIPLL